MKARIYYNNYVIIIAIIFPPEAIGVFSRWIKDIETGFAQVAAYKQLLALT